MESDLEVLSKLFPNLSAQLRLALQNLHLAAAQLVPAAEREKDAELDRRAALLDQSYYRLLRLVNELSAAALFSAEKHLQLKNADLSELLHRVFSNAESLARSMGLELRLICPKAHHICALDAAAIEQLLYQLLSNAMKFTPAGGQVTLELRLSKNDVQLLVSDTGCGISQEELEALRHRHVPDQSEPPVPPAGLGLGLLLCRRIAALHNGTLDVVSSVGEGTAVTLTLRNRLTDQIGFSDVPPIYSSGFNPALVNLADALPASAFCIRNQ